MDRIFEISSPTIGCGNLNTTSTLWCLFLDNQLNEKDIYVNNYLSANTWIHFALTLNLTQAIVYKNSA